MTDHIFTFFFCIFVTSLWFCKYECLFSFSMSALTPPRVFPGLLSHIYIYSHLVASPGTAVKHLGYCIFIYLFIFLLLPPEFILLVLLSRKN